jgi:hypothetical protein
VGRDRDVGKNSRISRRRMLDRSINPITGIGVVNLAGRIRQVIEEDYAVREIGYDNLGIFDGNVNRTPTDEIAISDSEICEQTRQKNRQNQKSHYSHVILLVRIT